MGLVLFAYFLDVQIYILYLILHSNYKIVYRNILLGVFFRMSSCCCIHHIPLCFYTYFRVLIYIFLQIYIFHYFPNMGIFLFRLVSYFFFLFFVWYLFRYFFRFIVISFRCFFLDSSVFLSFIFVISSFIVILVSLFFSFSL